MRYCFIKCFHEKKQKANESFKGIIWERITKLYILGVYDASQIQLWEKTSLEL